METHPGARRRARRGRGAVLTDNVCVDCHQPATSGLGTTHLCQRCKWEVQAAILARRPDLRAPTGIGIPTRAPLIDGGLPVLQCDLCKATWPGVPFMLCPWCVDLERYQTEEQSRMNRARYNELLQRIRDGDLAALGPAITLARRIDGAPRRLARTLAELEATA